MKAFQARLAALVLFAGTALSTAPAWAQMSSMMNNVTGGGSSMGSTMGSMMGGSGMGLPSLSSAPPTNIAGLLQYCVKNDALGGNAAEGTSVQQSLLQKATGSSADPTDNSSFTSGASGLVDTGNGKTMNLNGSGVPASLTDKLCGEVLSHAKSLL
jgi:hypothetical protein